MAKVKEFYKDLNGNMCVHAWSHSPSYIPHANVEFDAKMEFVDIQKGQYSSMLRLRNITDGTYWYMLGVDVPMLVQHSSYGIIDGTFIVERRSDRYHLKIISSK